MWCNELVASQLDIPHYVLDYESKFKEQVIDDFADEYLAGRTPIPCVKCNQTVKFTDLFKMSKDLNADALASASAFKSLDILNRSVNFTVWLHLTHGIGVLPAKYSSAKSSITCSLNLLS